MAKIRVVTALLIVSLCAELTTSKITDFYGNGRIVGGEEAPDGAYPYQVSLRKGRSHRCGGSILNKEWILSSAGCVGSVPDSVVVGTNALHYGGDSYQVEFTIYPDEYNGLHKHNDVGLVKVKGPIIFKNNVQPIQLDKVNVGGQVDCLLTGWGRSSIIGDIPEYLQQINLTTTTRTECQKLHSLHIIERQICTLARVGEGACFSDAGGPLVRTVDGEKRQIGIMSWSNPCARGIPDVYTRVSFYLDWINENCENCISSY